MTREKLKEVLQGLIQSTGKLNIKPEMRIEYILNQLETLEVIKLENNENSSLQND